MKKQIKNLFYIVLIVIAITSIILYVFGVFQNSLIPSMQIYTTDIKQLNENPNSATYMLTFTNEWASTASSCNMQNDGDINFVVSPVQSSSSLPVSATDLQNDIDFKATSVQLFGINALASACSGSEHSVNVIFNNTGTVCHTNQEVIINKTYRTGLTCKVVGKVIAYENNKQVPAAFGGSFGQGIIIVDILKKGAVCQQNCGDDNTALKIVLVILTLIGSYFVYKKIQK